VFILSPKNDFFERIVNYYYKGGGGIVLLVRIKRHPGKIVILPWDASAHSRSNLTRLRLVVLIPLKFTKIPLAVSL